MDDCETSDCEGEDPRRFELCSGGTDVASESTVYSDGARVFTFTGVDVRPGGRALDGLAVLVRGASWGDFARTVLGCDSVVEVRSVMS